MYTSNILLFRFSPDIWIKVVSRIDWELWYIQNLIYFKNVLNMPCENLACWDTFKILDYREPVTYSEYRASLECTLQRTQNSL